jgi:hypothetical protein
MKRQLALLISLFQLLGTAGVPVVAYSCVESGESGVASYVSGSPSACYAEACCDGDRDPAMVQIQSDVSCCDVSVPAGPESSRILLPGYKFEPAPLLRDMPVCIDASLPVVRIASTHPSFSALRLSVNLPLIV